MEYLLSVIIPVYKTEDYLHECMESIVSASLKEKVEVLLINDGSPDNSLAICREYESKYDFIRCIDKPNEGVSATRNLGIVQASGRYITFIDSDDFFHSEFLDTFVSEIKECSADTIFFEYEDMPCEQNQYTAIRSTRGRIFTDIRSLSDHCSGEQIIDRIVGSSVHLNSCWAAAFKKSFLIENNIRFSSELKSSEDMDFTTTCICMSNRVSYKDITSVIYRRFRGGSATNITNPRNLINDMYVRKKWFDTFKDNSMRSKYYANEFTYFLKMYYENGFDEKNDELIDLLKSSGRLFKSAGSKSGKLFRLIFITKSYRLGGKILKIIL